MVDKTNLISPPLNLLPPGEERFLGTNLKLLETKSQTSLCKNLIAPRRVVGRIRIDQRRAHPACPVSERRHGLLCLIVIDQIEPPALDVHAVQPEHVSPAGEPARTGVAARA